MNRLQKKCLIASAGLHLLLLVIILVGPAFLFSRNPADEMPVLDFVPARLVDALVSGGGNPNVRLPPPTFAPPAPAPPAVKPEPTPPRVEPKTEPRKVEPPPPEPEKKWVERSRSEEPDFTEKKPKLRLPEISTTLVTRRTQPKPNSKAKSDADAEQAEAQWRAEARRRSNEFSGAIRSLVESQSGITSVEMPGPGGGGPSFANYRQEVYSIYMRAWLLPQSITDESATALARITIARDGTVTSANLVRRSGDPALDASVERTLRRVTFIAPFPEGARDASRSYNLEFKPEAKRSLE